MDEIIRKVHTGKGYKTGQRDVRVVCFVDDTILYAENKDDLQCLLHLFNTTAKRYDMIISAEITKCLTTSREPVRCKLEIDNNIIKLL